MGLCGVLVLCDVGDVVWWRSGFGNAMFGGVWRLWHVLLKVCVFLCWGGCGSQSLGWVSFCAGWSWGCGIDVKFVRVGAVLRIALMGIWGW